MPFTGVGTLSNRLLNLIVLFALLADRAGIWPSRQMTVLAGLLALVALLPTFGVWQDASAPGYRQPHRVAAVHHPGDRGDPQPGADDRVRDARHGVGAASVYVLIALLWGTIYALLEFWWPGSFNFPARAFRPPAPTTLVPLMKDTIILYYSFETLTTRRATATSRRPHRRRGSSPSPRRWSGSSISPSWWRASSACR